MFQVVLIAVIAYLVACYGYGMFLLFRLYRSRPAAVEVAAAERQRQVEAAQNAAKAGPAPAARAA